MKEEAFPYTKDINCEAGSKGTKKKEETETEVICLLNNIAKDILAFQMLHFYYFKPYSRGSFLER